MREADVLLTFAELGIGLAGFSGIVVAFGQRGELSEADVFRFLSAFAIAICVVVLALLPPGLSLLFANSDWVWRISSGAAFAYFAIATPLFVRYSERIRDELVRLRVSPDTRFVNVSGVLFAGIALENAIGWPFPPGFLAHFLCLLIAFIVSAYTFAAIVIYRPRS